MQIEKLCKLVVLSIFVTNVLMHEKKKILCLTEATERPDSRENVNCLLTHCRYLLYQEEIQEHQDQLFLFEDDLVLYICSCA